MSAWLSFQSGGLFRTTDGGATWASTGWTGNQTVGDVACHPIDDQMLFVTQLSGGDAVLRSQDGGATFAPFSNGLENVVAPRELAFAGDSRLLLASAKGSYGTDLTTGTPTPTPTVTPVPLLRRRNTSSAHANGHGDSDAKTYSNPRPRPTPLPRPTPPG